MDRADATDDAVNASQGTQQSEPVEPIRVALLVDDDYLYRLGSVFGHTLVGLVDEAVSVTVVCPDPNMLAGLTTGPARVIEYRQSPWPGARRRGLSELAEELNGAKVNLIHGFTGSQSQLSQQLAAVLDRPYIVSATGLLQSECFWRIDEQRCRAMIAISHPVQEVLLETYRTLADRVHLVPPGCFCRARPNPSNPDRAKTIVSMGRFDRRGGYDLLLRAIKQSVDQGLDVIAALFGAGPMESTLREWARRAGLGARVTFLPRLFNWEQILDTADLYVQPGPIHQLHAGLYESIARGCPVVTTPDTAFDLVVENQTGKIFPTGDQGALTQILSEWLSSAEKLKALSEQTARFAKEKLSMHRAIARLMEVYRQALTDARG